MFAGTSGAQTFRSVQAQGSICSFKMLRINMKLATIILHC